MAKADSIGLTCEALRAAFDYDPDTGLFHRKKCADRSRVGDTPTSIDEWGYVRFRAMGKKYRAHVLAWFYVFGEWPLDQIDHINQVPADNKLGNLRDVTQSWNQHNRRRPRRDNALGILGVDQVPGGFRAQINTMQGKVNLGLHHTTTDAAAAYAAARVALHGGLIVDELPN